MNIIFSIFPIMFSICFFLIFAIIFATIFKGLKEWNKNNHSPKLTVPAKVISKRMNVSHYHHSNDTFHSSSSTSYYVTFEVESGDRMELHLSGREYGLVVEGDQGLLSFQGTRFLEFNRQ